MPYEVETSDLPKPNLYRPESDLVKFAMVTYRNASADELLLYSMLYLPLWALFSCVLMRTSSSRLHSLLQKNFMLSGDENSHWIWKSVISLFWKTVMLVFPPQSAVESKEGEQLVTDSLWNKFMTAHHFPGVCSSSSCKIIEFAQYPVMNRTDRVYHKISLYSVMRHCNSIIQLRQ